MDRKLHTNLRLSLRDKNNGTYRGRLLLKNWTIYYGNRDTVLRPLGQEVTSGVPTTVEPIDPAGASYYVIAVVLVYGMSIVALIASHIKRKPGKLSEDREINTYLREFQTVKEMQSRESYKNLKKEIKKQINWDKRQTKAKITLKNNLSQALLPMIAVGVSVPGMQPSSSIPDIYLQRSRSGSLFNSQTSIGPTRSRTSSVGSYASICSMPPAINSYYGSDMSPPTITRDRHRERKRGLSNLLATTVTSHSDYPLEKILEESIDSRASSFRRKSSKRSKRSSSGGSLNQSGSTKAGSVSHRDMVDSNTVFKPDLECISSGTSELGSSMEHVDYCQLGQSLGDSGMGNTSTPESLSHPTQSDTSHHLPESDQQTGVHHDSTDISPRQSLTPPVLYLTLPSQHTNDNGDVWIQSTPSPTELDSVGLCNDGFRQSPSPTKYGGKRYSVGDRSPVRGNSPVVVSRGSSPFQRNSPVSVGKDALLDSDVSDHSDSEAELIHITCV